MGGYFETPCDHCGDPHRTRHPGLNKELRIVNDARKRHRLGFATKHGDGTCNRAVGGGGDRGGGEGAAEEVRTLPYRAPKWPTLPPR